MSTTNPTQMEDGMNAGEPWIDRVMAPLGSSGFRLPAGDYNRIYEAVARGNEAQGTALVRAILNLVAKVRRLGV